MKNQKGFVVPLLIAIIAVLVIGGGVYVYKNKKVKAPAVPDVEAQQSNQNNQQTNIQTPPVNTQTSTANWKTYTNKKTGFEVKYPSILTITGDVSFGNPLAINTRGSGIAFSIASGNLLESNEKISLEKKGEIIIDGYKTQKFFRPLNSTDTTTGTIIYIVPEKNISILYYLYSADSHKISESDMNLILSTFKFTK